MVIKSLIKVLFLVLIPCAIFAQVLPAEQDVQVEENAEDVAGEHHMIYYDDLLIGTEFYLDGKVVNDLSEIRRYLLGRFVCCRHYRRICFWALSRKSD